MSINTAHASNGVLLHTNEYILLYISSVAMEFFGQSDIVFQNIKKGCLFMTSHRLIFNNNCAGDLMQSFSIPYVALTHFQLVQPPNDPEYIEGSLKAQPNGNFSGKVKFNLLFELNGMLEFFKTLKRVLKMVKRRNTAAELPAYTPGNDWIEIAVECWQKPKGHYEWLPEHAAFVEVPYTKVFTCLVSPPFPGIGAPPPYEPKELPKKIPTCTPCARYGTLNKAPGAIGFDRVDPCPSEFSISNLVICQRCAGDVDTYERCIDHIRRENAEYHPCDPYSENLSALT